MPRKKKITKPLETKSSAPATKLQKVTEPEEKEPETIEEFKQKVEEQAAEISNLEETKDKYENVLLAAREQYSRRRLRKTNLNYSNEDKEQVATLFGVEIGDL